MNERDRLRREIARRRKAATDKILRIRKSSGINLNATEHDPRIDNAALKNLSTGQLKKYLANLNAFTDRSNYYKRGARNTIISSKAWNEYKDVEAQYNAVGAQHLEAIKDIKVPHLGMTIGEREQQMLTKRAQGDIVNRPYGQVSRDVVNVEGDEGLIKLTSDMRRKMEKGYLPNVISNQRQKLEALFLEMGNPEWEDKHGEIITAIEAAENLSDHQFDVFYNYAGGASVAYLHYHVYKMMNARQSAQYEENFTDDIRGLFEWAAKLPRAKPRSKK